LVQAKGLGKLAVSSVDLLVVLLVDLLVVLLVDRSVVLSVDLWVVLSVGLSVGLSVVLSVDLLVVLSVCPLAVLLVVLSVCSLETSSVPELASRSVYPLAFQWVYLLDASLGKVAALSALQTKKVLQLGLLWSLVLHLGRATGSGTALSQRIQKLGLLGIRSALDLKVTESEKGRKKEALSKKVGHSKKAT
jgi:hypothetical protein